MKTYVVSLMQADGAIYLREITADSPREAVEVYINTPPECHPGARLVQNEGGLIGVARAAPSTYRATIYVYHIRIFRVAPGPKRPPEPVERAHIVEQGSA